MHPDHGCLPCAYQVPGCFSCSSVLWDTGIPLDSARLNGPGNAQAFLTCDKCEVDERFVRIELDPTIPAPEGFDYAAPTYASLPAAVGVSQPVKCSSCQKRFDGCSSCGTYGESCTQCY